MGRCLTTRIFCAADGTDSLEGGPPGRNPAELLRGGPEGHSPVDRPERHPIAPRRHHKRPLPPGM